MNLYNVTAKLTLDTSEYDKNIDKAKKGASDFSRETEKNIGVIATNAWIQIGEAVVKYGQKLAQATLDLINYADRYDDLSAKYDVSYQSLQELDYIASQTGTTLESLLGSMTMMYNRAKEDDEVFSKLGIDVRDVNGNMKAMDELFWETKNALDEVTNSGDRSALMLEAFGRNAMENGEFFRRSASDLEELKQQANDLGIVLEEGITSQAGSINDKLAEMQLRAKTTFTELILGAEGAGEKFDTFIDDLVATVDEWLPNMIKAGERLGGALIKGLWEIIKNNFVRLLLQPIEWVANLFGTSIYPKEEENVSRETLDTQVMPSGSGYEVNTNNTNTIKVEVEAKGDTEIDEENAEKIARKLAPIVDKSLGRV